MGGLVGVFGIPTSVCGMVSRLFDGPEAPASALTTALVS